MSSISEAPRFERNGPLKFSSVLEPTWNDDAARAAGKFPEGEFPYMEALVRFVLDDPEVSRTYMEKPLKEFTKVLVTMGGGTPPTPISSASGMSHQIRSPARRSFVLC